MPAAATAAGKLQDSGSCLLRVADFPFLHPWCGILASVFACGLADGAAVLGIRPVTQCDMRDDPVFECTQRGGINRELRVPDVGEQLIELGQKHGMVAFVARVTGEVRVAHLLFLPFEVLAGDAQILVDCILHLLLPAGRPGRLLQNLYQPVQLLNHCNVMFVELRYACVPQRLPHDKVGHNVFPSNPGTA